MIVILSYLNIQIQHNPCWCCNVLILYDLTQMWLWFKNNIHKSFLLQSFHCPEPDIWYYSRWHNLDFSKVLHVQLKSDMTHLHTHTNVCEMCFYLTSCSCKLPSPRPCSLTQLRHNNKPAVTDSSTLVQEISKWTCEGFTHAAFRPGSTPLKPVGSCWEPRPFSNFLCMFCQWKAVSSPAASLTMQGSDWQYAQAQHWPDLQCQVSVAPLEPTHWGLSPGPEQHSSCSLITQRAHAHSCANHVTSARTLWRWSRQDRNMWSKWANVEHGQYFLVIKDLVRLLILMNLIWDSANFLKTVSS